MRLSFFFTLRQTPPLFLIRAPLFRYRSIRVAAALFRYRSIRVAAALLALPTRAAWLGYFATAQYAPLGGAIAGRRYAPLRRYFAIAQYASLLRYWLCQYAQPGWAISLPLNTPSWRGYVLAAGGGLRAYAAHCPRSIAPFATSPKNDETRQKTTKSAKRAGFPNNKKRRNPPKNDETRTTGGVPK